MSQLLRKCVTDGEGLKRLPPGEVTLDILPFVPTLVSAPILLQEELEQIRQARRFNIMARKENVTTGNVCLETAHVFAQITV